MLDISDIPRNIVVVCKNIVETLERKFNIYCPVEEINNLKKNSLMHNARGAGRKAKFTDDQVDEIRRLREDGNTIKEIAKRYNCSVGLIHKLINEK